MCGLTGIFDPRANRPGDRLRDDVDRMSATLAHRGPDDRGSWVDTTSGIALGHTRLSVIDLSTEGRQPMLSACGRYRVVFNGEIYNFRRLRDELETLGHRFRGHSDTEVLLAAISEWGIENALQRFEGMLAMALWDSNRDRERALTLARESREILAAAEDQDSHNKAADVEAWLKAR